MALTANERLALRLLGVYTAGRFTLWTLAGNAKAGCRAHVMSALAGERVPQGRAGIGRLREAFYALARPDGNCDAA